jgi:hypothetical protein
MNFSWYNNNNINDHNYRNLTEDFCHDFYTSYDRSLDNLKYFMNNKTYITYINQEFSGVNSWLDKLSDQQNIYRITHHSINITAQPLINSNKILLSVHGKISNNNNYNKKKYIETLVVELHNNKFTICNYIIKIVD